MSAEGGADATTGAAPQITFTVKTSGDQKHTITVPENITVADLKKKLSSSEYVDWPAEQQRLIYSGRVLKDPDELSTYKIKDGNTVHMVKGAASRQNQQSSTSQSPSSVPPGAGQNAGVPQNLATGPGNDPLAGLTGARYAGFAQMPGAGMFGPDGGMGAPQGPEEMLRMLENPMFQSQMNEAMNNPHVIQAMQNSPMIRDQPFLRDMLNNPEMRRMMMDPQVIRASMQMNRMFGGDQGSGSGMPAPGVTDNTTQTQEGATSGQNSNATGQPQSPPPPNPFASMFGPPGGTGAQANPFAALFGPAMMNPNTAPTNTTSPPSNPTDISSTPQTQNRDTSSTSTSPPNQGEGQQQQPQPPANPFAALFGGSPSSPLGNPPGQQQPSANPIASMAQQMMQNPEMMRNVAQQMQSMGIGPFGAMGGGNAGSGGAGANTGMGGGADRAPDAFNPFAMLEGLGGLGPQTQSQDIRPPEEQYAEQLRQLNEMGLHDFDRNVRALRMAGGNVQAAIELLFSGTI